MSGSAPGETLPTERADRGPERRGPELVVAFACERPFDTPSRHALAGVDVIFVGRGAAPAWERTSEGHERRLALRLPDSRMSASHLQLTRMPGFYLARDEKSRNGTFVNGARVDAAPLEDGDVVEAGGTFFLYRAGAPVKDAAPLDAGPSGPPGLGLTTLLPELLADLEAAARLAPTSVCILVVAETGAGKEVLARAIHAASGRQGPYVPVNCGALPANLVETELFGYKRGAFSGAADDRPGLVRSAQGGTLFLDEIGDLPLPAQAALLRVLQEREVLPIGATRAVPVDVRVVAATHRDLEAMAAAGQFRSDLLARLSGYTFTLPPLRDRRCDIGLLVASLLARFTKPGAAPRFTNAAARTLFSYDWPHNVRELEKCLEAAAALAGDLPIDEHHLPAKMRARVASAAAPRALSEEDERHKRELVALLEAHGYNVSAVARATGKARMQIQRWMRKYQIRPSR